MITRLKVRGFKSLLDVEVQLAPLTVFVGANGSGKTSLLEAIDFLRAATLDPPRLIAVRLPLYHVGLDRLLSRQGGAPLLIESSWGGEGWAMELSGEFIPDSFQLVAIEDGKQLVKRITSTPRPDATSPDGADFVDLALQDGLPERLKIAARGIGMYRLDAEAMAAAAYSDETEPVLAFNGGNLAAVLDALQGNARDRFDEIERRMKEFVPRLKRVRVKRARIPMPSRENQQHSSLVVGHQVAFDFDHAVDINAEDASEGTLLLLGLLTIIECKPRGDVTIMLDDLDRALHPKAQRELVTYLHELICSRPGLQIIATTHSPYLVEHFKYDEVRAITQASDGTSLVASLSDHPQADRWRDEMSAGEFWSSVGESWIATAKP